MFVMFNQKNIVVDAIETISYKHEDLTPCYIEWEAHYVVGSDGKTLNPLAIMYPGNDNAVRMMPVEELPDDFAPMIYKLVDKYDEQGQPIGQKMVYIDFDTNAERREFAYNYEKLIELDGQMITVTEAAQIWASYSAEGNDRAEKIGNLIAEAKQIIRDKYPS